MNEAVTPTSPVPDALFDADFSQPLGREDWIDRFDWVIVDDQVVHAPAAWNWSCPECGASGVLEDPLDRPHETQHAKGVFGRMIPLELEVVRDPIH